jgi:hypothetical protein
MFVVLLLALRIRPPPSRYQPELLFKRETAGS